MRLPDCLVVEILSRLSEVSLARLRAVSKEWNALIMKDERLAKKRYCTIMLIDFRVYSVSIDLHQVDNNKVKIISKFSLKDPLSNNSLGEVDIRSVIHCDCLLLCTTEDNRLVVWNPCSSETRWIQSRNPYNKLDLFALSKSSCNEYKILRIDQRGHMWKAWLYMEIYDFTSNSWRVTGNTSDWCILRLQSRGMSVKGKTYWLADQGRGKFLQSFDFSTERFGRVSLPADVLAKPRATALSVTREEQKLCLLAGRRDYHRYGVDVWIANKIDQSNGEASWSKFISAELAHLVHLPFYICNGMNFLVDQKEKVLVCRGKNGVSNQFLHVIGEDNKYIQVDHDAAGSTCSLVLSYVPTLVRIS